MYAAYFEAQTDCTNTFELFCCWQLSSRKSWVKMPVPCQQARKGKEHCVVGSPLRSLLLELTLSMVLELKLLIVLGLILLKVRHTPMKVIVEIRLRIYDALTPPRTCRDRRHVCIRKFGYGFPALYASPFLAVIPDASCFLTWECVCPWVCFSAKVLKLFCMLSQRKVGQKFVTILNSWKGTLESGRCSLFRIQYPCQFFILNAQTLLISGKNLRKVAVYDSNMALFIMMCIVYFNNKLLVGLEAIGKPGFLYGRKPIRLC